MVAAAGSIHRGLDRIPALQDSLTWLAANHGRSTPSPVHTQDLLGMLVWYVSSWQWMPHCTLTRTSPIPRTSRLLPRNPHRDGRSRSGLATVHQRCGDSSPEHSWCRTSNASAWDGIAVHTRKGSWSNNFCPRRGINGLWSVSRRMCTPMTYWTNRSRAHVRARASFSIWAYRDSQSVIDRDAYATTFRSPFTSSCRRVAPSPYELASADMIKEERICIRARLVDRVRPTVPLSYSTGCVKYDDEFPGWMQFWPRQPGNALPGRAATGSGRIFHLAIQPGRQMMSFDMRQGISTFQLYVCL